MKLNTQTTLNDLDDKPIDFDGKVLTIGFVLERSLTVEPFNHIKPLKALAMAQRFHSDKIVEIDESDLSDLRQAIEESKIWTPIVKGRVLQIFING